jgi:lipoyl-dependent peroxiredoxin
VFGGVSREVPVQPRTAERADEWDDGHGQGVDARRGCQWDPRASPVDRPPAARQLEVLMAAIREGNASWSGDLLTGRGVVSAATTGVFIDLPVTWGSRTAEPEGMTSPEELLAAAHASCFSMACSNNLAKAGTPPSRLDVRVAVTADKREPGWTVISSAITVRATVPGCSEEAFQTAVEGASAGCPISRALTGNVEITVEATLEG